MRRTALLLLGCTCTQVMITDAAGKLEYLLGTPGSFGIPQTTTQLICNVLDHGMDMQEAIEAPRVSLPYETEGAPANASLVALLACCAFSATVAT